MRSRLIFLSIGLVVGVLGTNAFAATFLDKTTLVTESGSFSAPVPRAVPGKSYTFVAARICLTGSDSVTFTDVRATSILSEVKVVDFAVAPSQGYGVNRQQDISTYVTEMDAPFTGPVTKKLVTRCSEQQDQRDLAVEMKAPDMLPAIVSGFDVTYRVGGDERTVRTEDSLVFCSGTKKDRRLVEEELSVQYVDCEF